MDISVLAFEGILRIKIYKFCSVNMKGFLRYIKWIHTKDFKYMFVLNDNNIG